MQQSLGYYITPPPYLDKKKIDERKLELKKLTWSSRLLFHAKWIFFYIWATALVTILGLLSRFGSVPIPYAACMPDGTFRLYNNFSRWPMSTFFEVTVRGGSFSFTQAKMIDLAWDLIVGRAGQAALAYFSWREFSDYVALAMENRPINYSVFRTIFISQEASIGSLWCLIRNIRVSRAWRSTTTMCFVITSLAFTVAFPTLAGAITGYVVAVDVYIIRKDGLVMKFSDFNFDPTVYDFEYVQTHGVCVQIPDRYQWGFSLLPLFLFIIALLLWTFGVVLMHCKTSFCIPLVGYPEVPRGPRCILHYADAMRDQLLRENIDPGTLTKKELDKEIASRLGGGSVSWTEPLSPNCVGLFRGFLRWLARENWWWPAIFVFQASTFLTSLITFGFTRNYVTVVLISWAALLLIYVVILTGQLRGHGTVVYICVLLVLFASAALTLAWAILR